MKKIFSYSALAALLVLTATGCSKTDESKSEAAYTKAWQLRLEQKYAEAVAKFEEAANLGHVGAQVYVGSMYYCGLGVKQDFANAAKWYKKAADAEGAKANAYAMYQYAEMLRNGEGVDKDDAEAKKYYEKAEALKYSPAAYQLGKYALAANDPVKAIEYLTKAADLGYADAQFMLSGIYEEAKYESAVDEYLKKHDKQALSKDEKLDLSQKLMLRAVAQKHPGALQDVYEMAKSRERNDDARGLPQDWKRAVDLYSRAAEQGHAPSQYRLGELSREGVEFNGETVLRKDEDNAEKWFGKAAEQKHEQGLVRVCEIAEKYIKAGKKNLGINWYKRAAKIGYEPAKKALADLGQRF